ncbi:MAG: tryptophan synthase subunit beta [Bacillota bacterium]|jgi:tryptophan synthase beta chain
MYQPTKDGFFGDFGGRFVPPGLEQALQAVTDAFMHYRQDVDFLAEFQHYLKEYVGRPNPLTYAARLSDSLGGARIYLKREDLNHTGAHKINNAIGQALLAKRMGKQRIVAETGAGQHGVATATVCALLGLDCVIYMGEEDTRRQALNVFRMQLLGAKVISVSDGTATLKDAVDAALMDYAQHAEDSFYLLGSAVGPHPYPLMVREFQSVIGREARSQMLQMTGKLPDYLVACVGGGSNAIGLFAPFYGDRDVQMIGVEPGGKGLASGQHAASISAGSPGIIHGFRCYTLQDEQGQPLPVHSVAAGLDYPGVGPEHSFYHDSGRAQYVAVDDQAALQAFCTLCRLEGIIPALESSHAVAYAMQLAPTLSKDQTIVVNLSGRGDKDVQQVADML